jgi:IMP dehydrogenase/GMP reductase
MSVMILGYEIVHNWIASCNVCNRIDKRYEFFYVWINKKQITTPIKYIDVFVNPLSKTQEAGYTYFVDKVIEKRNERKRLVEESKKLEEESTNLDNVTKELVTKRDKLKQEKEKKEKELDEKRNAELKKKAEEADKKRSVFDRVFNRVPKEEYEAQRDGL